MISLSFLIFTFLLFDALDLLISNQKVSSRHWEVVPFPFLMVFSSKNKNNCLRVGVKSPVMLPPCLSNIWNPPSNKTEDTFCSVGSSSTNLSFTSSVATGPTDTFTFLFLLLCNNHILPPIRHSSPAKIPDINITGFIPPVWWGKIPSLDKGGNASL